jgi:hypothetical protein
VSMVQAPASGPDHQPRRTRETTLPRQCGLLVGLRLLPRTLTQVVRSSTDQGEAAMTPTLETVLIILAILALIVFIIRD